MTSLGDLVTGARLLAQLPSLLRCPVRVEEARPILRRRLELREADFLGLAKLAIFDYPESPYRELLGLAGCEYGDLVRLVHHDGVEGALRRLLREGVYLTVDEFKGRCPVRRGAASIEVGLRGLRNPRAKALISGETSGSRGARAPVPIDVAWVRDWAVDECLDADARGGLGWTHGRWAVPGGASVAFILLFAAIGTPPVRSTSRARCDGSIWASLRASSHRASRPLPGPSGTPGWTSA